MEKILTAEEKRHLQNTLKEAVSKEYAKKKKGLGGKQVTYLGSETVVQVLNEVVPGAWSFEIIERFREEMYIKPDKNVNQFEFAGYSYSVHARLTIDGLGSRDQFGAKEGVGNKGVDTNAYKAASSSALVKCAALFDIGRDIYTSEKEQYKAPQQEQQWAQQPQQQWEQQPQYNNNVVEMPQQQQWQQDPYQQQQGFPQPMQGQQQPFFPEPQQQVNPFVAQQTMPQGDMQYYVDPTQQQQPDPNMYYQQPQQGMPQAFPAPMEVAPPATEEQREMLPSAFWNPAENLMQSQTQQVPDIPFENVPPKQEEVKKGTFDERYMSKEAPSLIAEFTEHRKRLGLLEDKDLNATLRDYFRDANATIASVTNETIGGVVEHLRSLQAV